MKIFDRKLIMEDGSEYYGYDFGSGNEKITEVVFNTSPVGYQEIISDPSYTYQTVVMAYPLIGNYGIAEYAFGLPKIPHLLESHKPPFCKVLPPYLYLHL